ncbi:MAG: ATP synthase F0 subunit B [Myxococcota bacterium]
MKPWLALASGLAILLLAPEAWSAEEVEHGPSYFHLALQVFNVAVLGYVLYRFAGKPISEALRDRSDGIRAQIAASETRLREAEAELAELRRRLAAFDEECAALVNRVAVQAQAERERTLERARQSAERIREEARRVADNEIVRARQVLRDEAAELATSIAAELLRERITRADDERLLADFVDRARELSA